MSHILVAYSTTDGHTPRICERLRQVMAQRGHSVTVTALGHDLAQALADARRVAVSG